MDPEPLRVLIVDDHEVVRLGVRQLLEPEPGIAIVGEAASAAETLTALKRDHPDVVLLDISLRDMSGIDLTRRIRAEFPETRVVILTMHEGEEYFLLALRAGASGYVIKGAPGADIARALHAVQAGGTFLTPDLATGLVTRYLNEESALVLEGLTSREREVTMLLIEGLSNQEIALRLDIGVTTVQTHRSHVMEKLGLRNYGDLVRFAIRHGLAKP